MKAGISRLEEGMRDLFSPLDELFATSLARVGLRRVPNPARHGFEGVFSSEPLRVEPSCAFGMPESPFAYGRSVRVDGGEAVQALSTVFYPRPGSGLPIFGSEILCFRRGVHLFVLDLFPMHGGGQGAEGRLSELLEGVRGGLEEDFTMSALPEWGARCLGPSAIMVKPGARANASVTPFIEAYAQVFEALIREGAAVSGGASSERADESAGLRRQYLYEHGHHQPAGGFMERIAGEQWAREFVFDLLYPTWLYEEDGAPSWGPSWVMGVVVDHNGQRRG